MISTISILSTFGIIGSEVGYTLGLATYNF